MKSRRILICGVGSVGERHLRNLLALGQTEIALYRSRGLPLRTVAGEFPVFSDLDKALETFAPEVAFITGPTALHVPVALKAAQAGCHLLIEKPVSHSLAGVEELARLLKSKHRFGMVAYMLRFHPLLKRLKTWLDEGSAGTLGVPVYARVSWGEHVPDWHPWEDYAESYAVRRDLGGGPALTYSHDLDTVRWLLGDPVVVGSMTNRALGLQGDTEHGVDWLLRFPGGATAHLHADYYTRPLVRSWELVATRGRVVFDYQGGTLTRFAGRVGERPPPAGAKPPEAEVVHVPARFDRNDMFVDEIRYFLNCVELGVPPRPDIEDGAAVLRLSLAALAERPNLQVS